MRKDELKIGAFIVILSFILIAGCTSSQPDNVTIHLMDQTGTPVVNASIVTTDHQFIQSGSTDENGNVSFVMNRNTDYTISISNIIDGQTPNYIIQTSDEDHEVIDLNVTSTEVIQTPTRKLDPALQADQAYQTLANNIGNLTHN